MSDKFTFIYQDPDSGSQVTSSTPNGIYDTDQDFQTESLQVCKLFLDHKLYTRANGYFS